jgi:hypothetical protein
LTDKRKRGKNKKAIKPVMDDSLPQDIHNTINGKDVVVKADASISSTALNSPPSNVNLPVSRFGTKQKSYNALAVSGGHIYEEQIKDLQWPRAYHTYNMMANDDAVSQGYFTKRALLWIALSKMSIKEGKSGSVKAKEAKDLIGYIFANLDQSWYDVISNVTTYSKYGFSLLEIVPTTITEGKWEGGKKLKKLSPISPKSIEEWVFTDDQRKLLGILQSTAWQNDTSSIGSMKFSTRVDSNQADTNIAVPIERLLHFAYNSESENPQGDSQFKHAYIAWKEKYLIQDLALVGISKDMSGVIEISCPVEIMNKAAADPTSPEAAYVEQMQKDAANISANSQAFFMVPSDMDEGGKGKLYSMTIKGVEGGSKNYNADEMIKQRRKAILDTFGVGFLDNDSNSYSSGEAGASFHELLLQNDLSFILEQFNNKLLPTMLALNGMRLDSEDMPYIEAGRVTEPSRDETSKFIQRVFAVNGIPRTKEIILQLVKDSNLPTTELENMKVEEIWEYMGWNPNDEAKSKAGEGMKTGMSNGTGSSSGGSGDGSTSNNENTMETSTERSNWKYVKAKSDEIHIVSDGVANLEVMTCDLPMYLGGDN